MIESDGPTVYCKLEFLNPSGSTKDRIASYILTKAWRQGVIHRGSTVIEASSGSTSIAMALVCAQLGVRFIAVMPEGVSNERSLMIRAYGGEVRWSPKAEGIAGSLRVARKLASNEDAFLPLQFENPDNAAAHRYLTAQEIICQVPGETVDAVVSGVGTGGTLVGLYQGLRDRGCEVTPFAAIPVTISHDSASASQNVPSRDASFSSPECCSFSHAIPGVVDQMSKLYRPELFDGLVELQIEDTLALETTRRLIARGFPVGPSSGLNYAAAVKAATQLSDDAVIVTVFPDRMERYFSTELFSAATC
jgi:cysteine synthase A